VFWHLPWGCFESGLFFFMSKPADGSMFVRLLCCLHQPADRLCVSLAVLCCCVQVEEQAKGGKGKAKK
jgi:hypothetical protein